MKKIALLGFGNVGQGILELLNTNQDLLSKRCGQPLVIQKVLIRNIDKAQKFAPPSLELTTDPDTIFNDPDIDIIIEVMGGEHPALEYIQTALNNKKHVITANKELIAKHKKTLFALARKNNVELLYEAAVGGAIPIIRTAKIAYAANDIENIAGILNGTTNFILTKIKSEKGDYNDVLKKAQELGFAEADPTMDVSGLDAAYKLVILANSFFKIEIDLKDVYYEGIENISLSDIQSAERLGYTIKLLALGSKKTNGNYIFKVHPTLLPNQHLLAQINNEFNALFVTGNAMGEALQYGKGAGPLPTASAIISDVVDISVSDYVCSLRNTEAPAALTKPMNINKSYSQFFIRLEVKDEVGVLETLSKLLRKYKISISKMQQQTLSNELAEIIIITHLIQENEMQKSIKEFKKESVIQTVNSLIRVGFEE